MNNAKQDQNNTNNNVTYQIFYQEATGKIFLAGVVTFKTASKIRVQGTQLFNSMPGNIEVDLAKVTQADSSALALLLAWMRDAKAQQNKTVKYYNLPQKMLDLGRFNGLDAVLPVFANGTNK